jgi:hypothetical protein
MPTCPTCRSPLKRDPTGLLRCNICGFVYKPGQTTPLLQGYIPKRQIRASNKDNGDVDQTTFIDRVIDRIIPLHQDYTPEAKRKLTNVRHQYRQGIKDVFNGKKSFNKWYEKTRKTLGIHEIDLTRILYESLEGLTSVEARQMREQWGQALQDRINSYNPTV